MNRRIKLLLLLIFLSLFMISGYMFYLSRFTPQSSYNFLKDEPCAIPCWENIVPSETTELETLKLLMQEGLIDSSASYVRDNWLHFFTQTEDRVSIFFLHEKVRQIDFDPDTPLLLNTMVDKFGIPEKIHIAIEGEHEICHVGFLYYPEHGLRIKAGSCEDFNHAANFKNGNVMPNTPVLELSFVEVAANSEHMLRSFDIPDDKLQEIISDLVDWNGYSYYSP